MNSREYNRLKCELLEDDPYFWPYLMKFKKLADELGYDEPGLLTLCLGFRQTSQLDSDRNPLTQIIELLA